MKGSAALPRHNFMSGKRILTALLVLALPGLLGACGPGNTLARRHAPGADGDSQLKTVETGLHQLQEQVNAIKHRQAQNEAHIAELQKRLGLPVTQVTAPAPAVPQGSALGAGFTHPEAEAPKPADEAAPSPAAQLQPQLQSQLQPQPTPAAPAFPAAKPQPALTTAPPSPLSHAAEQTPYGKGSRVGPTPFSEAMAKANARKRRGIGNHVGPAPTTPEAAIAADRSTRPAASAQPTMTKQPPAIPPEPAATTPPVQTPAPAASAAPTPTAEPPATASTPTPPPATAQTPPPASPPPSPVPGNATTASAAEKTAYNQALQLAINGHRAEAKAAFDQFMTTHPRSPLVPNALYWVGEGAYQSGDYQAALTDFEKVAKGWPGHHKASDSLYKIAMTQEKSGNIPAARATLERYLKEYPNAELAGAARQKLQTLGQ